MNARTIPFELSIEGRLVDEVVACIFHSILFHRSSGKFTYANDETYSIRSVGYVEVDCDFLDFTYVCCESDFLCGMLKREITDFSELLRGVDATSAPPRGSISLEFYHKRRTRWPFQPDCIPWEVWTVYCEVTEPNLVKHENVIEMLQDKMAFITDIINRNEYVPKMPFRSDTNYIFDTTFSEIQPYMFKVHYNLSGAPPASVGNTVRKLIRDTLAL